MDSESKRMWFAQWTLAAIGVGLLACSVMDEARSHEALPTATQPLGWSYGFECCHMRDCSQAPAGGISETPLGYRVNLTGEIIPYKDSRIKRSKDEYFHRCTPGGNVASKRSLCLYIPDRGF